MEKYFLKAEHKNLVVRSLKDKVEKRLKQMVERNPLRVDYYQRYQEIIEDYNRGKDAVTIEETYKKLIEFVKFPFRRKSRYQTVGAHRRTENCFRHSPQTRFF